MIVYLRYQSLVTLLDDVTEAPVFNKPQLNILDLDCDISLGTNNSLFNLPEVGADDLNDCSILSITRPGQENLAPISGTYYRKL